MTRTNRSAISVAAFVIACAGSACERKDVPDPALDPPPDLPERVPEAPKAASEPSPEQLPTAATDAAEVTDAELEQFSKLQIELSNLQSQRQAAVKAGKEPVEAQRAYEQQVVRSVAASGLSAKRYEAIARQVTRDPELQDRVSKHMKLPSEQPQMDSANPPRDPGTRQAQPSQGP